MILTTRKTQYALILLAMAACMALQLGAGAARRPASKKALKSKLGNVEHQIRVVKHKIEIKESEKRTVTGQLSVTESKLEDAQSSLSENKLHLLDAQSDLAVTVERLARTQRQLDRRQKLLRRRVIDIYEGDDIGFVNVVLGASNMWTFLTRAYYLQAILEADTTLVNGIIADKKLIEQDKARQAKRVGQIQGLQVRLEAERNQVASLADARRAQLDRIENSIDLYEKAQEELEAKSREIESQIRQYQTTRIGRIWYARPFKGGLILPVRGRITSRFGYRVHPITHVYKLHTGVDISVPIGTPVHAAADGVVIKAGWEGAYGYAVIIDHGGGVQTLYGHCSSLLCRAGQVMKRGQVIALSGSTGYSTGPHCHFEKRVNGSPVNPF